MSELPPAERDALLDVIEREYAAFRRHHAAAQTRESPEGFARLFREWMGRVLSPAVCRCDCAYVGAQPAGTPIRCERCGGLVDEVAAERMETVYAESRRRLEERAATRVTPPDGGRT